MSTTTTWEVWYLNTLTSFEKEIDALAFAAKIPSANPRVVRRTANTTQGFAVGPREGSAEDRAMRRYFTTIEEAREFRRSKPRGTHRLVRWKRIRVVREWYPASVLRKETP